MTTAPTPPAVAMADLLEYLDDGGLQFDGQPLPDAAASELIRLQAENERLQQLLQCDTPRYCSSVQRCTAGDEHRAELEARKPLPLSDAEIIAAQEALALSRSRIGLPCTRCGTGKYRADCNAYHDFHRCDSCMHVPIWGADGKEFGAESLIASREVVADGPVRVTRLHLTEEGRAALTSKAAGPLPGITGGSS